MKDLVDRGFVITLIIFATVAALIGMVAGPFGESAISIGSSIGSCFFSAVVIFFGLRTWNPKKKDPRKFKK